MKKGVGVMIFIFRWGVFVEHKVRRRIGVWSLLLRFDGWDWEM